VLIAVNVIKFWLTFFWGKSEFKSDIITLAEVFLHFCHHFMKFFNEYLLKLQDKSINATHLYQIIIEMRSIIKNRTEQKFFGVKVAEYLRRIDLNERQKILTPAVEAYKRTLEYFDRWFDSEKTRIFKSFSYLSLNNELKIDEIQDILKFIKVSIDEDQLFDEISLFNLAFASISDEDKALNNDKLWVKLLKINSLPNLTKIVESVLCVPIANDFIERLFSQMKKLWDDERSLMSIDLVRAEICIKSNFQMSCIEFADYVSKNEAILKAAKSNKKYTFKYN